MKKNTLLWILAAVIITACNHKDPQAILLVNHIGYDVSNRKSVILQTPLASIPKNFQVVNTHGKIVYNSNFKTGGKIDNWHTGKAYKGDFSDFKQAGTYHIQTKFQGKTISSADFEIKNELIAQTTLPLLLKGLKSIHPDKKYEQWDSTCPFHGKRQGFADVHGGWYDASGDYSKYLSHLCYTNFMTPQQTPMLVYNLYQSGKNMEKKYPKLAKKYFEEAAYGADFLVRMQDDSGYFYTIIFDTWSKVPEEREICVYETEHGNRTQAYQAAFREGAGMAIAALAKLSANNISGEYDANTYLKTAEKGFAHLLENNTKYCDNGKENIIDDYCALMAAAELYTATKKTNYLIHARMRAQNLNQRIKSDARYTGWFTANDSGSRPYFHAVEAGLPLIALSRYLDIETDTAYRKNAISTIQKHVAFTYDITQEVINPFGYPRQYVKATNETKKRSAFFIPHHNESGYWYQGENARLASLAAAFNICKKYMTPEQQSLSAAFCQNQINWILGLNPFDICMLDGVGRNNPEYLEPYDWNYLGGIANGITAGVNDESDIDFLPDPQKDDPAERWRWPEQWIPHAAWFMLAVTTAY